MNKNLSQKGFTLIELLIVIVIIATLAVTVFVALNPAQRLKDSKDARRTADVDSILTAIHAAIVDNKGAYPTAFGTPPLLETQLGTGVAGVCSPLVNALSGCSVAASTACINPMVGAINLTKYLKSLPIDPTGGTTFDATKTGYTVAIDVNGIVTVRACGAEVTGASSSR